MKWKSTVFLGGWFLLWAGIIAAQGRILIGNASLQVNFNPTAGQFTIVDVASMRTFVSEGSFLLGSNGTAAVVTVTNATFGPGQEIQITHPNGNRDAIMLFTNLPFAVFQSTLTNATAQTVVANKVSTVTMRLDDGEPAASLVSLGTGGLLAPGLNPGSYEWLAVVDPTNRNGIVSGWITADRGSGIVFSSVVNSQVQLNPQVDYGRLQILPGQTAPLEMFAVGYFADGRVGLETWANTVAQVYKIHLPPQPVGYCTWYSQPHGGASDEQHLAELSAFAATHLAPFGLSLIQIDDKWQAGISTNGPHRNFTTQADDGPYPSGMKAAADNIKSLGLTPGLWFMPFAGTYYDPFFKDQQDWFVKHDDGRPYETAWGGTCLDMTQSGAREHLRSLIRRIAQDWGYQYFKMDGLWTGTGTKLNYINTGYKEDGMGDAMFENPGKSNIEAYRDGLRLVREAAGPKVFILGCCAPQNMRSYGGAFGLVDAMRIGPDNGAGWKALLRGPTFGSRQYFLNGRVWYNDPDPVYVRATVPLNHAQAICSWVTLSGQMNLSSEWLPGLPPERLDILKRTMPGHGLLPRPADLFECDIPSLWLLTDTRRTPRRDVIGIFNWNNQEQHFDYVLDRLGLEAGKEYVAFDYWRNVLVPSIKGHLQMTLPSESCCVLSVRPQAGHPQLLSTSRHITQGMVDVQEEKWDETTRTLSGRSQVVGGDLYELRVVSAEPVKSFQVSDGGHPDGIKTAFTQVGNLVRARIETPSSREVAWSIKCQ